MRMERAVVMRKYITIETNYGMLYSNLKRVMDRKNISINMMSKLTGIKYDVIKRHYYNETFQADYNTLAKFCYVLGCKIEDILVYECTSEKQEKQRA